MRNYFGNRKYVYKGSETQRHRERQRTHTYYSIEINLIIACWEIKQSEDNKLNHFSFISKHNNVCKDGAEISAYSQRQRAAPVCHSYTLMMIFCCELDD